MGWNTAVDKKELILKAAEKCLRENQLSQLNIRDVAKEAGVSLGSVHYYFASKEHILMEIFRLFVGRVMEATLARSKEADPKQIIVDFVDGFFEELANDPGACHIFIDLWANVIKYKELKGLLNRYYRKSLEWLTNLIRKGKDQGIFKIENPAHVAVQIIAIIDGLKVQIHLFESDIDFKKTQVACREFILNALRAE